MLTLLQAVARQEGFYTAGTRPARNNNPGDLRFNSESQSFGAPHGDPGYAVFPDGKTGWKALQRWLSVPAKLHEGPVEGFFLDPNGTTLVGGYLGATLAQVIHRFAPAGDNNDTQAYIDNVVEWTGLTAETIITADLLQTPEAA